MKTTYIYGIRDLEVGGFIYVGKSNKPKGRCKSHIRHSDIKYLRKYVQEKSCDCFGLEILEKVGFEVDRGWVKRERFWVRKLRREGHPLLNKNDGGQGPSGGHRQTEESNAKRSVALSGRTLSEEHRANISVAKRGKKNPNCSREMSGENNPMYGKHHTEETNRKNSERVKKWLETHDNPNVKPYPSFVNIRTGGVIPAGRDLAKLCRELELNYEAMRMVARGHNKQTRDGWRLAIEKGSYEN